MVKIIVRLTKMINIIITNTVIKMIKVTKVTTLKKKIETIIKATRV